MLSLCVELDKLHLNILNFSWKYLKPTWIIWISINLINSIKSSCLYFIKDQIYRLITIQVEHYMSSFQDLEAFRLQYPSGNGNPQQKPKRVPGMLRWIELQG